MNEETVHTFGKSKITLRELLPLIRMSGYSNHDELETKIILCPECEEWTWVTFNSSSGFLDLLGDIVVESVDAEDGNIRCWIKTDDYNWFKPKEAHNGE